jgi:outer membrane protein OmpA-like peptidoglycan-associated protein
MTENKISKSALIKTVFKVKCGEQYTVTVVTPKRKIIELEDVHFNHNSSVLLPGKLIENDAPGVEPKGLSGINALASCLNHAASFPDDRLFIAGHTDTSGEIEYNAKLSMKRAQVVHAALTGNRDKWATLVMEKDKVEDRQYIFKWFSQNRVAKKGDFEGQQWDCDPGTIDNKDGLKTKAAVRRFQELYKAEFSPDIKVDGIIGSQTWSAIFDVYMNMLKDANKVDDAKLASLRNSLKYVNESLPCAGCGESHPIEAKEQDNYRSKTNRRVEMLFIDKDDIPEKLTCIGEGGCSEPDSCPIYCPGWNLIYIDFEGEPSYSDLIIEWPEVLSDRLPSDLTLTAHAFDTSCSLLWSAGEVSDSERRFVFERLRINALCTLEAASGSKTLTLWDAQDITDPQKPPTWKHIIEEFMEEEEDIIDEPAVDFEEEEVEDGIPRFD